MAALITFSFGVLAFLAWLYASRRSRKRICFLKTAVLYFVGGGFLVAIPQIALEIATVEAGDAIIRTGALLISAAFFEELLKIMAARTQRLPQNIFAIVALFGIYELVASKPLMMILENDVGITSLSDALLPIPALFFHTFTAAIYAFVRPHQPLLQFILCFGLHIVMNLIVFWWVAQLSSYWLFVLLVVPLGGITLAIWRRERSKAEALSNPAAHIRAQRVSTSLDTSG